MTLADLARGAYLLGPEILLVLFSFAILLVDLFLLPAGNRTRRAPVRHPALLKPGDVPKP